MHITRLPMLAVIMTIASANAPAQVVTPDGRFAVAHPDRYMIPIAGIDGPHVCLASQVIGAHVQTMDGVTFGTIDDVVVHPRGDVAYAVIAMGGFLGMGEKLVAVPWGALSCIKLVPGYKEKQPNNEPNDVDPDARDRSREKVTLLISKSLLKDAPGLSRHDWPAEATVGWTPAAHSIDALGYERSKGDAWQTPQGDTVRASMISKVSDLRGQDIRSPNDGRLGELTDLGIDLNGRVSYVIVSVRGTNGWKVGVPWQALTVGGDFEKDEKHLTLATTKAVLVEAPDVRPGKDNEPQLTNPVWIEHVYEYYGLHPYWSRVGGVGID